MSDVDPRRGACLPTDEGLEELVFKELWRGMAGVSSHLRASKVGRDKSSRCKELCAAQGSDGVPDAKIQLTTGTTFRVTALIFFPFVLGLRDGDVFRRRGESFVGTRAQGLWT